MGKLQWNPVWVWRSKDQGRQLPQADFEVFSRVPTHRCTGDSSSRLSERYRVRKPSHVCGEQWEVCDWHFNISWEGVSDEALHIRSIRF